MSKQYSGPERRMFYRLDYETPLAYKICREETVSRLLEGYTSNVSQSGLLCNIKDRVHKEDILWLSFDKGTLNICQDLERQALIYQNGIIGKVARVEDKSDGSYSVGVHFITREEKNFTHIYPKVHFIDKDTAK